MWFTLKMVRWRIKDLISRANNHYVQKAVLTQLHGFIYKTAIMVLKLHLNVRIIIVMDTLYILCHIVCSMEKRAAKSILMISNIIIVSLYESPEGKLQASQNFTSLDNMIQNEASARNFLAGILFRNILFFLAKPLFSWYPQVKMALFLYLGIERKWNVVSKWKQCHYTSERP